MVKSLLYTYTALTCICAVCAATTILKSCVSERPEQESAANVRMILSGETFTVSRYEISKNNILILHDVVSDKGKKFDELRFHSNPVIIYPSFKKKK